MAISQCIAVFINGEEVQTEQRNGELSDLHHFEGCMVCRWQASWFEYLRPSYDPTGSHVCQLRKAK